MSSQNTLPVLPKAITSWFNATRKHCNQCGKVSTKADHPTSKSCGSTTWNFEDVTVSEHIFLTKTQSNATSLVKMMNVMEVTDEGQSWEKKSVIEVVSLDRQKKGLVRGCRERSMVMDPIESSFGLLVTCDS